MNLFAKKATNKISLYYSVFTPNRINVSVFNTETKVVDNHVIELENINNVEEFFNNEKNVCNEIFNVLNKLTDYDKTADLVLVDKALIYSYSAPKMNSSKVGVFLNKELEENFGDISQKYETYINEVTSFSDSIYNSVVFIKKEIIKQFEKMFGDLNLNFNNLYSYENVFGNFAIKQIDESNFVVVNMRKSFTSIILVLNKVVVDYMNFNEELKNPDVLRLKILALVYKHNFEYAKIATKKVYIATNLVLSDEFKQNLEMGCFLPIEYLPFSIRDLDRYKFSYKSTYKGKKVGGNAPLKKGFKIDWKALMTMEIGGKKKKGFSLVECIVSLAIISILAVTIFASILLAQNISRKEVNESFVSTTIQNFKTSFYQRPSDAINMIYDAYDLSLTETSLDKTIEEEKVYTFYFDNNHRMINEKRDNCFEIITDYKVSKVNDGIFSYSFFIKDARYSEKSIIKNGVDFGEVYVKN